jgi:prepilin-type N-terminal cleavage/methylation domain-containing protein
METARTGAQGVTLVELMVALALSAMLLAAVLAIWGQTQQAYLQGSEAADVQQQVRLAMDQVVRAIQGAGANPRNQTYAGGTANDPAFVAFRQAGPNCLRIYTDLDGDGLVTGPRENLHFNWTGSPGPLTEEAGGGPDGGQPWVTGVGTTQEVALDIADNPGGTPMFQYFTGPNDPTPNVQLPTPANTFPCANTMADAQRARIGRVVITMTARGTLGGQAITRTLVSEARPRNVP